MVEKIIILAEYSNFADIFLKNLAKMLLKYIRANEYVIKLEKSKKPPYGSIFSLKPIEFKIFKSYMKINLANSFIRLSKLLTIISIFLDHRFNSNFLFVCQLLKTQKPYNLKLIIVFLDWKVFKSIKLS